ncbi:MAG: hypothetical protein ACFCD0_01040 [Gemmataceae bacterium]
MKRLALVLVLLLCCGIFVHGWQVGERKTPAAYPKHDFSKEKSYQVQRDESHHRFTRAHAHAHTMSPLRGSEE